MADVNYDIEALRRNIDEAKRNIQIFEDEIKKEEDRVRQLREYIRVLEEKHKMQKGTVINMKRDSSSQDKTKGGATK